MDLRRSLRAGSLLLLVAASAAAIAHGDLLAAAFRSNPIASSPEALERGLALYAGHCAVCHGESGHGDGRGARGLPVPPDDLAAIPAPPVFPDGVIWYRILHGIGAMPAFREALTEEEAWHLVVFVRALPKR